MIQKAPTRQITDQRLVGLGRFEVELFYYPAVVCTANHETLLPTRRGCAGPFIDPPLVRGQWTADRPDSGHTSAGTGYCKPDPCRQGSCPPRSSLDHCSRTNGEQGLAVIDTSGKQSTSRVDRVGKRGNCAPQSTLPVSGTMQAEQRTPLHFSNPYMTASRKAIAPKIAPQCRPCWIRFHHERGLTTSRRNTWSTR